MAQITLYIDDDLQVRLRESAARLKVSQSQFVADLVRRATQAEWPLEVLQLAGSMPNFPLAEELRSDLATDAMRTL